MNGSRLPSAFVAFFMILSILVSSGCMQDEAPVDTDKTPEDKTNETKEPIVGCTNSTANNFNPNATVDDDSCIFEPIDPEPDPIEGCTNLTANNFNQNATVDDGSCTFDPPEPDPIEGCTNLTANNFNQKQFQPKCNSR